MKATLRGIGVAVAGVTMMSVVAACSSGGTASAGGTASSGGSGGNATLTIAMSSPPQSLDPSQAVLGPYAAYADAAYAPLLDSTATGFVGDLAESWGYIGTGNTEFQVKLRPGLKFADGTPLTAQNVVDTFNYDKTQSGANQATIASWTATASGALTVIFHLGVPEPVTEMEHLLSDQDLIASPISPAGLKNPASLKAATEGAGEYVLDTSATIPNATYVYTPNKNYWNQSAIHYSQITIKVIPDMATQVQALESGEVNFATIDPTSAAQLKGNSSIDLTTGINNWFGVHIFDRDGELVPALKSIQVRQALNYATNKDAIAKAVWGSYGSGTDQYATSGPGYDPALNDVYPYDPAKAKQLLAAAGYANGFTIPISYQSYDPSQALVAQAIQQEWAAVGVKVQLTADSTQPEWVAGFESRKQAGTLQDGGPLLEVSAMELNTPGVMNPFNVSDPSLSKALDAVLAASPSQESQAEENLNKDLVAQAFEVPIASYDNIYAYSSSVAGVTIAGTTAYTVPVTSWYPAN